MALSPETLSTVDREGPSDNAGFRVTLANFDGPFDLLLSLIGKRELDITEVALGEVTDEFLSYVRGLEGTAELDAASEFLVVAATLLDMKIVGLLPHGEFVDAEDVALLEARDLLFARLLQYRAFKESSSWFLATMEKESLRHSRAVRLEDKFVNSVPELKWTLSPEDFQALALWALTPKDIPTLGLDHLHAPLVSIREQAAYVISILRAGQPVSFRSLIAGVTERGVVVARFLAVLELYRESALTFEQLEPLGELTLKWVALNFDDEHLAHLGEQWGGESTSEH
ncbi:MAG: chromosome segregation protein ScpA [Microbacteriaceae bacterium BACL25 MAG-120322-bin65]|nr:MAG: chromosome segregation protein ScpA [Microbacteriaceae bacterium BACL25 MAG-120322-bin65]